MLFLIFISLLLVGTFPVKLAGYQAESANPPQVNGQLKDKGKRPPPTAPPSSKNLDVLNTRPQDPVPTSGQNLRSKVVPATVVTLAISSEEKEKLDATGKDLRRRMSENQKQGYALESEIQNKRAEYAKRAEEQSKEIVVKALECLLHPAECVKKPDVKDVFELLKDQTTDQIMPTVKDLLELRERVSEQEARRLRLEYELHAYQRDLDKAYGSSKKAVQPPEVVPPTKKRELTDEELKNAINDANRWCFEVKGDRCFDGEPDRFKEFLENNRDFKKRHEAAYRAPDDDGLIEVSSSSGTKVGGATGNCNAGLKGFTNLQREITRGNIPPEASSNKNIEFAGCEPKDKSEIPPGWIACQCPGSHPNFGYVINGTRWHDPKFHCP